MKYQIFTTEETAKLSEVIKMLDVSWYKAQETLRHIEDLTADRKAQAERFENEFGPTDELTLAAWEKWANWKDEKTSLQQRISEIEDALRFNNRLASIWP